MSHGSYATEHALILAVLVVALILAGAILAPHAHELEHAIGLQRTDESLTPSARAHAR